MTGRVGTLGTVQLHLDGHAWFSDNSIWIEAQNLFSTYFFLKLTDLKGMNCGSTQPLLRQGDLKALRFVVPAFNTLANFESVAKDLYSKIHQNLLQVDRISVLRDTLLPKLMSGEVRVQLDQP